ncbi:MAG: helix-turn-helix transcriptional regulator [Alphaproteobacteria bacterium]
MQSERKLSINRVLRRKEVERVTGLSRSTIYQRMSNGTFPKPVPLGPQRVGWMENELVDWIEERVRERDASPR